MLRYPFTGQHKFLGYFVSSDLAHEAWRAHKHQIALVYADQQPDQRIAAALRTALRKSFIRKSSLTPYFTCGHPDSRRAAPDWR